MLSGNRWFVCTSLLTESSLLGIQLRSWLSLALPVDAGNSVKGNTRQEQVSAAGKEGPQRQMWDNLPLQKPDFYSPVVRCWLKLWNPVFMLLPKFSIIVLSGYSCDPYSPSHPSLNPAKFLTSVLSCGDTFHCPITHYVTENFLWSALNARALHFAEHSFILALYSKVKRRVWDIFSWSIWYFTLLCPFFSISFLR